MSAVEIPKEYVGPKNGPAYVAGWQAAKDAQNPYQAFTGPWKAWRAGYRVRHLMHHMPEAR